jgi:hypothetical protein
MKPALIAAIALASAVSLALRCEAEPRPSQVAPTGQSKQPPSVSAPVNNERAATNNYGNQNQPPNGNTAPQWILIVVGVVTAGFICWQALETRRAAQAAQATVGLIQRQADLMEMQTGILKKSVAAAETSANAATESAKIAREALRLSERADVLLDEASLSLGDRLDGGDCQVIVKFTNFGRTRALNAMLGLDLDFPDKPDGPEPPFLPPLVIGAGDSQTIRTQRFIEFLTEETVSKILGGQAPLKFIAQICYDDVFGDSHATRCEGDFSHETRAFTITRQHAS